MTEHPIRLFLFVIILALGSMPLVGVLAFWLNGYPLEDAPDHKTPAATAPK